MSGRFERVQLLLSQRRYDMAEKELRLQLADDPNDATMHALLALTLSHDDSRLFDATEEAKIAIGLEPDQPIGHYALGIVLVDRKRFKDAINAINQSLSLDPYNADAFAVLAQANLGIERNQDALTAAENGLAVDAENLGCSNMRSFALEQLGRVDEALQSAGQTLRRDPDDPMAHATYGYTLLNAGKYQEAQVAFREALRLSPGNEFARSGMITALNSRSWLFRSVHKFYVMMGRLNSKAAFAVIFGAWLLVQVLNRVAAAVPELGPFILPLLFAYVIFVVLTWIATPLFNTFLRFHPFGQHLLNPWERWASNLIAPCLVLSLFGFVAGTMIRGLLTGIVVGWYWFVLSVPISAVFAMGSRQRRAIVAVAAIVVVLLPVWGLANAYLQTSFEPLAEKLRLFGFGMLAIQIGSQMLNVRPEKT